MQVFKNSMKNILDCDPKTHIIIKGAHLHNLKYIDLAIPRNKLTVITGLSGSGKSSLAFDTLYAEGQRRYVESLVPAISLDWSTHWTSFRKSRSALLRTAGRTICKASQPV